MGKRNKGKRYKKIILKGSITKYTEYKHKNTGTSCMTIHTSCLQGFNLSRKC